MTTHQNGLHRGILIDRLKSRSLDDKIAALRLIMVGEPFDIHVPSVPKRFIENLVKARNYLKHHEGIQFQVKSTEPGFYRLNRLANV